MKTSIKSAYGRARTIALQQRQTLVWIINIALAASSYAVAYIVRFDTIHFAANVKETWQASLPIAVALKILMLLRFKVFSGLWRYVSAHDLLRLLKAMATYALLFLALTMLAWGHKIPRSVYLLDFVFSILAFGGVRLSVRLYRELRMESGKSGSGKRFLIIGAGDAAEIAARSLLREDGGGSSSVVGYIDDDPHKEGRMIHGTPVLGGRARTAEMIRTLRVTDVLFAISDAPKELTEYILNACSGLNVVFRILPSFCDIATGRIEVQRIRSVEIEDLLGRRPVKLESDSIRADLQGETILVTGAGGSIGSEMARQIAGFVPARLVLLDSAETPLFEIQQEILKRYPAIPLDTLLCNIKNKHAVDRAFHLYRPSRVYHAAAYKHVPMLEAHPDQAVLNNIGGTHHLADAACRYGTKRFVMISTDKAVHPTSVMGASKRICELIVSCMPANITRFAAVRFGNVLGSNGSVIPTFKRQIANGGPVTVTHPDMTRYFMTIPEAVQLVLHCGTLAAHNDIFVLDMGEPVRIMDLARNMIRLSGLQPDTDIEMVITGLRPGEKMHEELITYGEELQPTTIEKINVLRRRPPPLSERDIMAQVKTMQKLADNNDIGAVKDALWSLIRQDAATALTGESNSPGNKPCTALDNPIGVSLADIHN